MRLLRLEVKNYRILRDVTIDFEDFNLFIGPNAAGKSTILDALRFLHEGIHARDFQGPILSRGGLPPTSCALAAASADATFPARDIANFVRRWGFFDPNPFLLRRDWAGFEASRLDHYGRNLAETLYTLKSTSPDVFEQIRSATQDIVGLPTSIDPRESEDRRYFVQTEEGLQFTVHQMGVSSGTLRMLALMTALHGEPGANLLGIEEPENYVHPSALSAFVEHTRNSQGRVQFMVTTHSPLLLDLWNDPRGVYIVQRGDGTGTTVSRETNPEGVRKALDESGFSLGEYYQTMGFGAGSGS